MSPIYNLLHMSKKCSTFALDFVVGSDDQRLSYCVTNVVVVLPPLPTD